MLAQPSSAQNLTGQPSRKEIILLVLVADLVFLAVISALGSYWHRVEQFGDNTAYMSVAFAIRHWNFTGLFVKHFWGLPYLMAALSVLTGVSVRLALLLISFGASVTSVALADRLWGSWVAGFFVVLSFDWMQRSFLGGSEPLFVALLFASMLAVRRERWLLAACLASLATTVRPLGFCALVAIGLVLLWHRAYRTLLWAVMIGLGLGSLYALPLTLYFGDPLATVHSYQQPDPTAGGSLFGFPFVAIIKGTLFLPSPWTNLVLSLGWICFVLAGIIAMVATRRFREFAKSYQVEVVFVGFYLLAIFSYNYPVFARGSFPRFVIPALPLVLLALEPWLPKYRSVLWCLGVLSPALAAASAMGIQNTIEILRRTLTWV